MLGVFSMRQGSSNYAQVIAMVSYLGTPLDAGKALALLRVVTSCTTLSRPSQANNALEGAGKVFVERLAPGHGYERY